MTEAELKADRCRRADRQEEDEVKALRDKGYVAYRIDREIDTVAIKDGEIWLCDCKFSDNGEFYISKEDIAKGLDTVLEWAKSTVNKIPIRFRIDMHFPRHKTHNRKYILVTEYDRGYSIKVARNSNGRFTTTRIKR
jgi:Holliday junction resolvase